MDAEVRLTMLEAENELLREQVRRLEQALTGVRYVPFEWGLTTSEALVVGVLVNREIATKDAIMAALYRDMSRDEAEIKIVDVFICKVRRKLKPFAVTIETVWGVGYRLDAEWRDRLRRRQDDDEALAAQGVAA
jgi:two-component system cell cycle response regulator CtrA